MESVWIELSRQSKNVEGRRLLCENRQELDRFHEFLPFSLQDESLNQPEEFVLFLTFIRNISTSTNGFVDSLCDSDVFLRLGRFCQCLVFADKQESFAFKPEENHISLLLTASDEKRRCQFVRLIAQSTANFAAVNEESANHMMRNFILPKIGLRDLLAACKVLKEDAALSACWTGVLNATRINTNPDSLIGDSQRDLLCQLFLSAHDNTAGAEGVSLLCRRLLTQSFTTSPLVKLFHILGPISVDSNNSVSRGTLEQVALLFGLDTALEQGQMSLTNSSSQQLIELLTIISISPQIQWALSLSSPNNTENNSVVDNQIRTDIAKAWTVAMLSLLGSAALVILSSSNNESLLLSHSHGRDLRRLIMRNIMPFLFQYVLSGQDPVSRRTLSLAASNGKERSPQNDDKQQWIGEAIRQGLRLFTILLQEHADAFHPLNMQPLNPAEEEILLPYLASLLQHCATDFTNPLCREWALLGIQALMSRSIRAREMLAELQPQGIIEDEGLRQAGLRARLDHATGRVVMEKTSVEGDN